MMLGGFQIFIKNFQIARSFEKEKRLTIVILKSADPGKFFQILKIRIFHMIVNFKGIFSWQTLYFHAPLIF
jgi:hypothetical protein